MTLLHSAPREVYRVYSEEEFWSIAERQLHQEGPADRSTPGRAPDEGQRTLRRLAASTVLLTALGTCGVLVTIAAIPSGSRDGHRGAARLLAATGSLDADRSVGTHIWQQASRLAVRRSLTRVGASVDVRAGSTGPATVHASPEPASPEPIAASHARSAPAPSAAPSTLPVSAEARLPSASAAAAPDAPAGAALAPAASVSEASAPEAPASEAMASEATASTAAPSEVASSEPSQDQDEFGFER